MRYFSTFALVFLIYLLASCSDLYISIHESSEKSERSVKTKNCVQSEPCQLGNGVRYWMSNAQLKAEEPFEIFIEAPHDMQIQGAHIEGVSMYMGKIPIFFHEVKTGRWKADAMLGSCNLTEMKWRIVFADNSKLSSSGPAYLFSYRQ
ncbi:hypothetical protein PL2TA16_01389 [Pseudoalteromonas luteoviolacea 2ta16]|uniref:Lipoprotein n=1 Tax=Pseudoalteromonas luteoviolacea (strain 2ta16) TaxID=1353533 RepID=V4HML7_PSEL2|nr:hypothetical protein PL2TA16_01389 [Pseudoalteromonas luteoviolacea 2ta16]